LPAAPVEKDLFPATRWRSRRSRRHPHIDRRADAQENEAIGAFTRVDLQDHLLTLWADFKPTLIVVTHDVDESLVLADRMVVMRSRPGRVFAKSRPLCRARATANPPLSISSNAGCARAHQHHRRPRKPARARVPRSGGERRGAGLAGVIHIFIPIA
jgi:hypothetical protein